MKLSFKAIFIPTLVLFCVCLVCTAALAGVNLLTVDTIAQVNAKAEEESRLIVLPDAETFEGAGENNTEYYIGKDNSGNTVGYAFTTDSSGYGGKVSVMTGINVEGKVTGVAILSHSETPGLGSNAEKDTFRQQYLDNNIPGEHYTVIKSGTAEDGQILALSGATITSNAVTNAINTAMDKFNEVKEAA